MVDIMSGRQFETYIKRNRYTANIENGILRLTGPLLHDLAVDYEGCLVLNIDGDRALVNVAWCSAVQKDMDTKPLDIEYSITFSYIVYPYFSVCTFSKIGIDCTEKVEHAFSNQQDTLSSVRSIYKLYRAASLVLGDSIRLRTAEMHGSTNISKVYFGRYNIEYYPHFIKDLPKDEVYKFVDAYMSTPDNFDKAVEMFMHSFHLKGKMQFMALCSAFDGISGSLFGFCKKGKSGHKSHKSTKDFLNEVSEKVTMQVTLKPNDIGRLAKFRNKYFHGEDLNTRHSYYDIEIMRYLIYCLIAHKLGEECGYITPFSTTYVVCQLIEQYKVGGSLENWIS